MIKLNMKGVVGTPDLAAQGGPTPKPVKTLEERIIEHVKKHPDSLFAEFYRHARVNGVKSAEEAAHKKGALEAITDINSRLRATIIDLNIQITDLKVCQVTSQYNLWIVGALCTALGWVIGHSIK